MKKKATPSNPFEAFQLHLIDAGRATNTIRGYTHDLQLFARWFEQTNGKPLRPQKLTSQDAREYQEYLVQHKASAATILRHQAALRAYAAWARAAGLIDTHPINGLPPVEQQKVAPKWLEKDEQGKLRREVELAVNAARTEAARRQAIRDQAIVLLLFNTGLRVSELCALELGDVTLTDRKGLLRVRQGKGNKQRDIPLNADARRALKNWLGVRPSGQPYLFVAKKGQGLRATGVQRMLAELGRRAGVEVTPHTLRHSFGKNLINAGVSLEMVAALLGHSDLNTTRLYTIPSAHDLNKATAVIGG